MMKARRHIYLDDALFRQLDRLAEKPGATQSAIVEAALRSYFLNQGAPDVDAVLKTRLEKFSGRLGRIERDIAIVMESLALFVRFELMVTSPLPEADQATARALAQDRFDEFVTSVGRRLANGKNFRTELLARMGDQDSQS
jgi:predicted transcriptional regulator